MLEILRLSLEEALLEAKRLRKQNFGRMSLVHLVNGYLLGPRCSADCIFCGWNRNITPGEPRPGLDNTLLQQVIEITEAEEHQRVSAIELINNTIRINKRLLQKLGGFSWACRKSRIGISIGLSCDRRHFEELKEMGYAYYVNDLETSPRIFPSLVTTHYWEEKLTSMRLCRETGLSLHSGFIMGFEETDDDLAAIFKTLKEHQVEGIVVNFYTHVNGVLHEFSPLTSAEVLRRLSQLRIVFPSTPIILGGGRRRWLTESLLEDAFQVVDSLYTRSFLNHPNPYWLRESEILTGVGL